MLVNWNSSTDFLDGAGFAYREVLVALWQPSDEPLQDPLCDGLSPEVRSWLDEARSGAGEAPGAAALPRLTATAVLFERFHGPPSLEFVRNANSLRLLRQDPKRYEAFRGDLVRGSQLKLTVAAVAEAERARPGGAAPWRLRRADRLCFECDFNLCDGIASPFRIVSLEPVLTQEAEEFDDAEAEE